MSDTAATVNLQASLEDREDTSPFGWLAEVSPSQFQPEVTGMPGPSMRE
jgi:hypothetical protein